MLHNRHLHPTRWAGTPSTTVVGGVVLRLRLFAGELRTLHLVFETFGRQASTVLTSALRSVCHVADSPHDQVACSDYVGSLGDPTYMSVFSMEPVTRRRSSKPRSRAAVSLHGQPARRPGDRPQQPERPLTDWRTVMVASALCGTRCGSLREPVGSSFPTITGVIAAASWPRSRHLGCGNVGALPPR